MTGHAWLKGLVNFPKAVCSINNFPFSMLLSVHVGCIGAASVYTRAVMEQGMWDFIKGVFKKSCSVVFWQRKSLRWFDAR
jgi:hypothetical protein